MSERAPEFVNEQGFRWYLQKELSEYAGSLGLPDAHVWIVRHEDRPSYFVATQSGEILTYAETEPEIRSYLCSLRSRLARPLRETVSDLWSSHEQFPKELWKYEVANDTTHLGYWEWVENKLEEANDQHLPK